MVNSAEPTIETAPEGARFKAFMEGLTKPIGSFGTNIDTLSKLIAAEEAMDAMAADRNLGLFYQYLELHSEKFLKANPLLLSEPWVRSGGAVHDMIQRLRKDVQEACSQV